MAPRFGYGFWRVRSRHAYSRCPDAARPGRRGFGRGHPHRRGGLLAPLPTAGLPLPPCIAPFQSRRVRGLRTARRVPPRDAGDALPRGRSLWRGAGSSLEPARAAPPAHAGACRKTAAKRRSRKQAQCGQTRASGPPPPHPSPGFAAVAAAAGRGDCPRSKCTDPPPHRQIPPATAWRPIWRTSGGHGSCPTHHIPTKFQRQNVLGRFLPYSGSLYVHTSY